MHDFAVQARVMIEIVVLAERFAVIGNDRDEGVLQPVVRLQLREQLPQQFVLVSNAGAVHEFGPVAIRHAGEKLACVTEAIEGQRRGLDAPRRDLDAHALGVLLEEGLRHVIRRVRVEQVHPQEQGTRTFARERMQPELHGGDGLRAVLGGILLAEPEAIEALTQARFLRRQVRDTDRRGRLPAGRAEFFGERHIRRREL